jgi:hypothetical protein
VQTVGEAETSPIHKDALFIEQDGINDLPIKMPTIEQALQTLPLAHHRPPD